MTLKEYLSQATILEKSIDVKLIQLEKLEGYSNLVFNASKVYENSARGEIVVAIIDKISSLQHEINTEIDRLVDTKSDILLFLGKIENENLKTIMEYHYLCGMTWEEIADRMYISLRQLYNWSKKAHDILAKKFENKNIQQIC